MDLISKKDLLAVTGISYGQLYRWKREKLIPEEWFIKRPSYTGQETFFPRQQILSRVQTILDAKDHCSLEELAARLSPDAAPAAQVRWEPEAMAEIDGVLLPAIHACYPHGGYAFFDTAAKSATSKNA